MHAPLWVSLRHFLMQNSTPGRHPLHVTGPECAPVSQTVAVVDAARQHIGDGLDTPVRMPGKSRAVIFRTVVAEVVEEKEWIEVAGITETEGATSFSLIVGLDSVTRFTGRIDMMIRALQRGRLV